MSGRRWSDGQHQAIEAKENPQYRLKLKHLLPLHTKFLLLYPGIAGMTSLLRQKRLSLKRRTN